MNAYKTWAAVAGFSIALASYQRLPTSPPQTLSFKAPVRKTASADYQPSYRIILEPGQPIEVRWNDGRVAHLTRSYTVQAQLRLKYTLKESTCTERPRIATCTFHQHFANLKQALRWKTHPDSSKIGTIVKAAESYGSESSVSWLEKKRSHLISLADPFIFPTALNHLFPLNEIECDNYDFLPVAGNESPPSRIYIKSWAVQAMGPNPETGVNENRDNSQATGVTLNRTESGRYRYTGFDTLSMSGSTPLFLDETGITHWTFDSGRADGSLCDVSFEIDPISFQQAAAAVQINTETAPTIETFESDEFTSLKERGLPIEVLSFVQSTTQQREGDPVTYIYSEKAAE